MKKAQLPAAALPPPASLDEIAAGVWAWIQPDGGWWINNAGFVAGADADVVIDTCATESRTLAFLAAIERARPGADLGYAINTHAHGDHTYGNSVLPATAVLIGHANMRAELQDDPVIDGCPPFWEPRPQWGPVSRRLPSVTLHSSLSLHVGGRTVELRHPGFAAHTAGDLVVWLPDQRVLFTGDLVFHGVTPMILMGSVRGALESLQWLRAFDADIVVPGHGPVIERHRIGEVFDQIGDYYRFVQETGRLGRRANLTPLEVAERVDIGRFEALTDAERLVLNLHRDYAEDLGSKVDMMAAFTDAVSFNGGPLPSRL